jgi:hypothetical protein
MRPSTSGIVSSIEPGGAPGRGGGVDTRGMRATRPGPVMRHDQRGAKCTEGPASRGATAVGAATCASMGRGEAPSVTAGGVGEVAVR